MGKNKLKVFDLFTYWVQTRGKQKHQTGTISVTVDRFFFSVEVVEVTHGHTYLSSEWRLEVGIPVTYRSDKNTKICRVFVSSRGKNYDGTRFSRFTEIWFKIAKQMSMEVSEPFTCICGICLPLNSSATKVYTQYPWSAVYVLHWR